MKNCLYILLSMIVTGSCISPVTIEERDNIGLLAVDGFIEWNPNEDIIISISRTQEPVYGRVYNIEFERVEEVAIISEDGDKYPMTDRIIDQRIVYFLRGSILQPGVSYKLQITDGENIYESGFQEIQLTPEIDSLYYRTSLESELTQQGVELQLPYINYNIDFEDSEDRSFYMTTYRGYRNQPQNCYILEIYEELNVFDDQLFPGQQIEGVEIRSAFASTLRYSRPYYFQGTLLKLSRSAYEFFQLAERIDENSGGIFDVFPSTLPGNLQHVNGDLPIYGLFAISRASREDHIIDIVQNPRDRNLENFLFTETAQPISTAEQCRQLGGVDVRPY